MSGWGAYGGNTKANPFAEDQDAKFENNPNNHGAWDIPLRDTDDAAPSQLPPAAPVSASSSGPAAAASASTWFGGKKQAPTSKPATKEEELVAREEELKRREAEINALARSTKNWPWFKPVLYHDIGAEVPVWNRSMVRFAYLGWLLGAAGFLVNWIVTMILMFAKAKMGVKDFFICSLASVIGLPLSFFLWYRSLYFASQTDGSVWRYTKTFLYIMLQLCWAGIVIVSPPFVGSFNSGALKMIDLFNQGGGKGYAFGIMCIINVGLWGLSSLIVFFSLGAAVRAMRAGNIPRENFEVRNVGSMAAGRV